MRVALDSLATNKHVAFGYQVEFQFRNVGIGENWSTQRNTPRSEERINMTLMGGERSHHCATPATLHQSDCDFPISQPVSYDTINANITSTVLMSCAVRDDISN